MAEDQHKTEELKIVQADREANACLHFPVACQTRTI